MDTLVITSLNPKGKFEYQKHCFLQWKKVGYKVKSFNCLVEAEKLIDGGIDADDIVVLNDGETAQELIGRPIPRILPVLYRAIVLGSESVLLTNSDIFPAHRKPVGEYLSSVSSSIGLCRSECLELDSHCYTDSMSYRGGLDMFFFTAEALSKVFEGLSVKSVAQRMTFGVPGWDYFLGHCILANQGGTIMDGEVFLHKTHKTSYTNIDEFEGYSSAMYESGLYENSSPTALAEEFADEIYFHCEQSARESKLLKLMYYSKPNKVELVAYSADVLQVEDCYSSLLTEYSVDIVINPGMLRLFIHSQLTEPSWSAAETFREKLCPNIPAFTAYLLLVVLYLVMKELMGTLSIQEEYYPTSLHGSEVRNMAGKFQGLELDEQILRMFAAELVDHYIFNKIIFNYIALSASTSNTLGLCEAAAKIINQHR